MSTWEDPHNKKRRLERTAFNQSTGYKVPRNIIRKIFNYKDVMNYIDNQTEWILSQSNLENLTQWYLNSKTTHNNKMNIIRRYAYASRSQRNTKAKYILKYVNSEKDYDDMKEYLSIVGSLGSTRFYTEGTLSRFMNTNASVRKNVLKDMRNERHAKVVARIGNKNAMVEMLWMLNETNTPRKRFESLSVDTLRKMLLK